MDGLLGQRSKFIIRCRDQRLTHLIGQIGWLVWLSILIQNAESPLISLASRAVFLQTAEQLCQLELRFSENDFDTFFDKMMLLSPEVSDDRFLSIQLIQADPIYRR